MSEELVEEFITVESIFVRGRNCLALRSKFSPLFTDYYLHLMQYGLRNEELYDSLLKELMAYFTLTWSHGPGRSNMRGRSISGRLPSPTCLSPVLP